MTNNITKDSTPDSKKLNQFVDNFRNAAPYINNFRGKIFVVYFSGEMILSKQFRSMIQDLNLLHSFGIKLVLVHGARSQIDNKLSTPQNKSQFKNDLRITDKKTIAVAKEVCGSIRFDIEALFTTFCKYHPDLTQQSSTNNCLSIISGNFVTAQPIGILNGIDFQHTGKIRKINTHKIKQALDENSLVLLSPIAPSPSGDIFNINSQELAIECTIALKADKLIYLTHIKGLVDSKQQLLKEVTSKNLVNIMQQNKIINPQQKQYYQRVLDACNEGVNKIHLINQDMDGALLLELFTNQGHGTLVSSGAFEETRQATFEDVSGILQLISPLEQQKIIVKRSRETLELEFENFYIVMREQEIIACGALYPSYENRMGELACLAVKDEYQNEGRGDKLFKWICQQAKVLGLDQIYALTTQTAHWFIERDFYKADISKLPVNKQKTYNYQRNSAVYIKNID